MEQDYENIIKIIKNDGKKYTVRKDRKRYFFPKEWEIFIKQFKNKKHRFFFITSLMTGARIMEVLNLKHENINIERESIKFKVTKQRKAKKNYHIVGKSREFFVCSNFFKEYKSFIRNKKIYESDYIFLNNVKLPKNYDQLSNQDKKNIILVQ